MAGKLGVGPVPPHLAEDVAGVAERRGAMHGQRGEAEPAAGDAARDPHGARRAGSLSADGERAGGDRLARRRLRTSE